MMNVVILAGCCFPTPKSHRPSCKYIKSFFSTVVVSLIDLISPQDISHENFLMNFWGVSPPYRDFHRKAPLLRAQFPVKYALIDFGYSIQFSPDADPSSYLGTWKVMRPQRAPETATKDPFDPFAADVYQTSRSIYGWCLVRHISSYLFLTCSI